MANAIFKKFFHFVDWRVDPTTKRPVARNKILVPSSPNPQQVEDWAVETDLYNAGIKEGSIIELKSSVHIAPKVEEPPIAVLQKPSTKKNGK